VDISEKRPLLFSNKAIVSLAIPIIIETLLSIMAGMVDSAMVASAGETAVSAVSLVDAINVLFISIFAAVANGGIVVTTQYIGSRDYKKAQESANQLMYATTAVALFLMVVFLCCVPKVLGLVYGSIETSVFNQAKTYFYLTLIGYPFAAIGNGCSALLRAMTKSRAALIASLVANMINVIGNAVLIFGFGLGVAGAAISTTVCRLVWALIGIWMLSRHDLPINFSTILKFRLNFDIMKRVMRIGSANGLENGLFQLGRVLISSLVATFGTVSIAAFSVSNTLCNLGWSIICSFGTVLLTVVGQCIGANEPEQAKYYTRRISNFALLLNAVLFGLIFLLRYPLVSLFSFGPEALEASAYYTGFGAIIAICAFYAYSFVPISSYRAAGDVRFTVVLAVSSMFIFRIGLAYLLGGWFHMGLTGVWLAMGADWLCRSCFNVYRYFSGKWLTKKVI